MKITVPFLVLAAALAAGRLVGASEAPPKPALKVDPSPVNDGKSALVASYAEVVGPAQKAVVSVYSTKTVRERVPAFPFPDPYFRQFFGDQERSRREEGLGSGVVVSADGYILTNNHVVEGADELEVALPDERKFKAKVIGTDPKTDIAVIKIEATDLPTITLADSDKLRVGDVVFAIGNPLALGQTVTMGIISATGRRNLGLLDNVAGYENFIQTDAAINMGNSGGALIDAKGRLVGINSAIVSLTRGNIGIGFAIPVNLASSIMQSLITTGKVARGFLGVGVQEMTPDLAEGFNLKDIKGVIITNLTADGPAAKAGLKLEDVITTVNGQPVESLQDLRLFIAQNPPGTKVKVQYLRGGKSAEVEVELGRLADEVAASDEVFEGVTVARVTDDLRETYRLPDEVDGLVVTEVADKSPFRDRLRTGMVILQINRVPVEDLAQARKLVAPGRRNICMVWDRGAYRYLALNVP